ncbi:MAG TPA: hypothetical protein VN310_04790 [Candidatus Dormibacteraeota bacterium]|jgi:hypothetical protein|nr:hypothetical protein [Candidatus Dormibacteraeota bacterium]
MPPTILARFIETFAGGLLRTTGERWFDGILIAAAALVPWMLGRPLAFWEGVLFATVVICLVLAVHVIITVVKVWKAIKAQPLGHLVESPIYFPNNKKESTYVPDPRPKYFRLKLIVILVVSVSLLTLPPAMVKRYTPLAPKGEEAKPTSPPPPPISISMDCEFSYYPLTIPPNSTIHIMQLMPDIFEAAQRFSSIGMGVMHDVSTHDKPLNWPTKGDGVLLSQKEFMEEAKQGRIHTAFMYKCDLSTFGNSAIEDIAIPLYIGPNNKFLTGRTYPIAFDPLAPGAHFQFYMVNYCENQDLVARWTGTVNAHLVGEAQPRTLPLKIAKRATPGGDEMFFARSACKWAILHPCNWRW